MDREPLIPWTRPGWFERASVWVYAELERRGIAVSGPIERLLGLSPRVAELSERLADYRIPETLIHGDLNDGNVFVGGMSPVFIDWGDGCISHPFYSLRTVLVSAEISLGLEENFHPLRDAYLAPPRVEAGGHKWGRIRRTRAGSAQ